jgi:hypothetical protein
MTTPAPAFVTMSALSPATARTIGFATAIASKIFEGMTVLKSGSSRRCTRTTSLAFSMRGMRSRG